MTKAEIIDSLAKKTDLTKKDVENVYNATFELIKDELAKGNDVAVSGFGAFKVAKRAARTGLNPQTKEKIKIPARKAVTFKPGKALKEEVNK